MAQKIVMDEHSSWPGRGGGPFAAAVIGSGTAIYADKSLNGEDLAEEERAHEEGSSKGDEEAEGNSRQAKFRAGTSQAPRFL